MNILGFVLLLVLGSVNGYLPPSISVCNRDDPDLSKCVLAVVEKMRSNLASGDYGNGTKLPSLDPAFVDRLEIDGGPNLQATFRDLLVTGTKNFRVDKIQINVANKTFNMLVTFDKVQLKGKYNMKMRLSLLLIDGDGDSTLDINDVKLLLKMNYFVAENDNGRKTIRFHPIDVKIKFAGDAKFHMTNLLKGRPRLSQAANDAINESPELILEKGRPAVEKFFSKLFTTIANGLLKEADEEEAFPR